MPKMSKLPKINESLRSVYSFFKYSLGKPERENDSVSPLDILSDEFLIDRIPQF
jgi:hypothetical protein